MKDTLHRVHFLANNLTGWAVGENGWVLKTTNGGATWTALFQKAALANPSQSEELFDVHFQEDGVTGWLVGLHGVWFTTTGGSTESAWNEASLFTATGSILDPAQVELYALDVVQRGTGVLALAVAEPGYVLRSTNAQATAFQVVWNVYDLCGSGVLAGCETSLCNPTPTKYEPWDVEISRNPSSEARLALVVGGIGGAQCGFIVRSSDDGLSWVKELHECQAISPSGSCDGNPLYEDDPTTLLDTWRHKRFTTLYGVAILDGDNGAVAAGYNAQHVYRDPATGLWRDRSSFSNRPVEATNARVFPFYGAVADAGTTASGVAVLTGAGGHVRRTVGNVQTWADDRVGEPWRTTDVCFVNASTGWQVGQFFRIAKSSDGGESWTRQEPKPELGTPGLSSIAFEPSGNVGVTVGASDTRLTSMFQNKPKILRTADGGATDWREASNITVIPGTNWDIKLLRDVEWISDQDFCAVGESGLIFRTSNGGADWTQLADPAVAIASFQKYEFEGVAFLDLNNGAFVGWKQSSPSAQALAYKRNGPIETWTNISPADASVTKLADVCILGSFAYAVGESTTTGGGRKGVVLRSTFSGGAFGPFVAFTPHPFVEACNVGGDLDRIPLLNEIAGNAANGDLWVGGECGRVWRYTISGGWTSVKSQTDGHVQGLSLTPSGHVFLASMRQSWTQQGVTRWTP